MSATATATPLRPLVAAPMMPTQERPELTHAVFMQHMTAMNAHYKAANSNNGTGPTHAYALPVHLVLQRGAVPPASGAAEVNNVLQASKNSTTAFAQNQTNAVNAATGKLQTDHDTSSFAAAMNAQRQKAKDDSDKQIDDTFNKLISIGTQHPETQQHILNITQEMGVFFTNLLAKVASFFIDIYNKIMGWIHSAVDWIKGAAAAVGDWLKGAVGSIVSFFGGL
jgi:hypothetical protein